MKSLLVALLGVAVLAAPVTETFAQAGTSSSSSSTSPASPAPSASPAAPSAPAASGSASSSSSTTTSDKPAVTTPAPGASGSASGTVTTETRRDDGASALPRSSVSERTTIFGLSPTAGDQTFADNGLVPQGTRVAFIQSLNFVTPRLSTTITGLVPGRHYRVTFRYNRRASAPPVEA